MYTLIITTLVTIFVACKGVLLPINFTECGGCRRVDGCGDDPAGGCRANSHKDECRIFLPVMNYEESETEYAYRLRNAFAIDAPVLVGTVTFEGYGGRDFPYNYDYVEDVHYGTLKINGSVVDHKLCRNAQCDQPGSEMVEGFPYVGELNEFERSMIVSTTMVGRTPDALSSTVFEFLKFETSATPVELELILEYPLPNLTFEGLNGNDFFDTSFDGEKLTIGVPKSSQAMKYLRTNIQQSFDILGIVVETAPNTGVYIYDPSRAQSLTAFGGSSSCASDEVLLNFPSCEFDLYFRNDGASVGDWLQFTIHALNLYKIKGAAEDEDEDEDEWSDISVEELDCEGNSKVCIEIEVENAAGKNVETQFLREDVDCEAKVCEGNCRSDEGEYEDIYEEYDRGTSRIIEVELSPGNLVECGFEEGEYEDDQGEVFISFSSVLIVCEEIICEAFRILVLAKKNVQGVIDYLNLQITEAFGIEFQSTVKRCQEEDCKTMTNSSIFRAGVSYTFEPEVKVERHLYPSIIYLSSLTGEEDQEIEPEIIELLGKKFRVTLSFSGELDLSQYHFLHFISEVGGSLGENRKARNLARNVGDGQRAHGVLSFEWQDGVGDIGWVVALSSMLVFFAVCCVCCCSLVLFGSFLASGTWCFGMGCFIGCVKKKKGNVEE